MREEWTEGVPLIGVAADPGLVHGEDGLGEGADVGGAVAGGGEGEVEVDEGAEAEGAGGVAEGAGVGESAKATQ